MMTDRHVVNSSLKNMLEKWRTDCLPLIIENFNTFSDEEFLLPFCLYFPYPTQLILLNY
jgi:hypothetical protein